MTVPKEKDEKKIWDLEKGAEWRKERRCARIEEAQKRMFLVEHGIAPDWG